MRIEQAIARLPAGNVAPLRGRPGEFRLKLRGGWRVIFRREADTRTIIVTAVAPRGTAYDGTPEEERQARVGDILTRIYAPARAADQAEPIPGTRWEDVGGGCELVVSNAVLYTKFLSGDPPGGQRRRSRWEP